jgi:hypothetical protein
VFVYGFVVQVCELSEPEDNSVFPHDVVFNVIDGENPQV